MNSQAKDIEGKDDARKRSDTTLSAPQEAIPDGNV